MVKLYHASPKRFKRGEILSARSNGIVIKGGSKNQHYKVAGVRPSVFMTDSPIPHYTIFDEAIEENWYVYQVEPIGKVWVGDFSEVLSDAARIIKCVGSSRGIAGDKEHGSMVYRETYRKIAKL